MLPDIHVDDRHKVWAHIGDKILVSSGAEGEGVLALVVDEPAPAGTLDGGSALVEHADEFVVGTPALNDGVVKRATVGEGAVGLGAQRVPEELVVKMSATVEADRLGKADRGLDVASCGGFSLLLEQVVQIVHVGSVVLAVVEVEEVTGHDGLKSSNLVRQVLKLNSGD